MGSCVLASLVIIGFVTGINAGRLSVLGNVFTKDGQRVFLSGSNLAWVHYAYDFGNNQYSGVHADFERYLRETQAAGGNSIRVWLQIKCESSPHFDSSGHVDKTDASGTLISDMKSAQYFGVLLPLERSRTETVNTRKYSVVNDEYITTLHFPYHTCQIYLISSLRRTKVLILNSRDDIRLDGLIRDTGKLQTYIDHALIPMVSQLMHEPAIGGWDIMNEAEGELKKGVYNNELCSYSYRCGMDWTVVQRTRTSEGHLTFYQIHTYSHSGHWDGVSPFQKHFNNFGLNKPVVIGEFRQSCCSGMSIQNMYNYAYYYRYAGAWEWQAIEGNWGSLKTGMSFIKEKNDQNKGGLVHIQL